MEIFDVTKLRDALARFLRAKGSVAKRRPRTLEWYQQQLEPWFLWLAANVTGPNDWLDPDFLELYLEEEGEKEIQDSTVVARFKAIRAFLNWQKRRRMISGDLPTELIEIPTARSRRPRVANLVEVESVIRSIWSAPENWLDYRDVLILQTLRSTGLRVEELTNLRTWQVTVGDGFVYIEAGKGDKDRIVPFDNDFKRAHAAYLFNRPPYRGSSDLLFLAANGHRQPIGPMSTGSIRHVIRRRCVAANIPYFNPHSVRHAWAIDRLNGGMALSAVSAAMGHTSMSFTARVYAKWVKVGLRREYDNSLG